MASLCTEQGYLEISVEDLTKRANVSAEDFETSFAGDKEACMVAAVNTIATGALTAISRTYSADRPEWDSYLYGIKALLELMSAQPSLAHMGHIASRQMGPPRVTETHRATVRMISAMLERLWDYSELDGSPGPAALGALGSAEAVMRREISGGSLDNLPRLLPDFVYAATVPFLGQEEALRLAQRGRTALRGTAWG